MADDLERRLEALGASEPPPLTDARLEAMGARVTEATSTPVDRGRRTMVLAVAAALIALLVAGIVMASVRGGDETRLDLADGVTLELPDGVTTPGESGDELAEGTVVSVAPGGSAVVDGHRFGPGRYVVIDGEIVPIASPSTTSTASTTRAPAGADPVGEPPGTSAPVVPAADADPPTRTTTTIGRTTTTTGTSPADRPVDRPPGDPDRSTTTRPVERPPTTSGTSPTTVRDRPTTTVPVDRPPPTTRPDTTTTTTTTTTTSTTVPPGDGGRDTRRP